MSSEQIQTADDEWLKVSEVAAMLKVSTTTVYQQIAKIPGCEPIRISLGKVRPDYRFHKGRLIAGLEEFSRNAAKEKTPG